MKLPFRMSLVLMFAVLALLAAACGTSDEQPAPTAPVGASGEPSALPPNPNPGDTPVVAGACAEGEPDCNDTVAIGDEPQDLPPPGDDVVPSGMLVDGGLSVADAVKVSRDGPIAVKGFLLIDSDGARLCELLAESLPPQCGGVFVPIEDFEELLDAPLANSQGVSWTDQHVSFLGEFVDGTFIVNATVSG
jgi:hypothetical protein